MVRSKDSSSSQLALNTCLSLRSTRKETTKKLSPVSTNYQKIVAMFASRQRPYSLHLTNLITSYHFIYIIIYQPPSNVSNYWKTRIEQMENNVSNYWMCTIDGYNNMLSKNKIEIHPQQRVYMSTTIFNLLQVFALFVNRIILYQSFVFWQYQLVLFSLYVVFPSYQN